MEAHSPPASTPGRAALRRLDAVLASPWLLAAVLGLGVLARCRRYFAGLSYWYDEAYLLLNVFGKSLAELAGPLGQDQAAPPLFLWLLRGLYRLVGPGEWALRLPSFLLGLLALFLMVPLARRVVGKSAAVWAAGWCALSHHASYHSAEVKPYSGDLLAAEAVLLAAAVAVLSGRRGGRAALLLLAALGPWLSFPGVFVLGGAGLALFFEAGRRRDRGLAWTGAGVCLLLAVSGAALWRTAARHYDSPALQRHWAAHFPDLSSPAAAALWTLDRGVRTGHYASTGLAVPLLLLSIPGLMRLWRRCPGLVVLLSAPLVLAWVAAALHLYPLGNRLLLFAAPCLWLPAAAGVDSLRTLRPGLGFAAGAALLLPGAVSMIKAVVTGPTSIEFREAFAYVHQHWDAGDSVWVSHPEVYEVYFGRTARLLGPSTPPERLERAAREGRVWMVFTPPGPRRANFADVFQHLRRLSLAPLARRRVHGLEIVLYGPAANRGGLSENSVSAEPVPKRLEPGLLTLVVADERRPFRFPVIAEQIRGVVPQQGGQIMDVIRFLRATGGIARPPFCANSQRSQRKDVEDDVGNFRWTAHDL